MAVMCAFLSLPAATFAFFEFAFAFAFTLGLAFSFEVKSIATTRGGFSRHVPILVQEVLLKRGKSALIESSVSTPGCNVRVELRPGLNRLRDVVSATCEELVVLSHRTAEIAEVSEKDEWCQFRVW